jgi:hypothetical protein
MESAKRPLAAAKSVWISISDDGIYQLWYQNIISDAGSTYEYLSYTVHYIRQEIFLSS